MKPPQMLKYLAYVATAALLGLLWYAALLFTVMRRTLLAGNSVLVVAGLCVISVVLAAIWRKQILTLRSLEQAAAIALGLPLVAALLFVWGWTCVEWLATPVGGPETVLGALGALVLISGGTVLCVVVLSFYVVIPMGALSLYVLRRIGTSLWPQENRRAT